MLLSLSMRVMMLERLESVQQRSSRYVPLGRGLCESHEIWHIARCGAIRHNFVVGPPLLSGKYFHREFKKPPFPAIGQSEFHLVEQP